MSSCISWQILYPRLPLQKETLAIVATQCISGQCHGARELLGKQSRAPKIRLINKFNRVSRIDKVSNHFRKKNRATGFCPK